MEDTTPKSSAVPVEAPDATCSELTFTKTTGKGLLSSEEENLALSRAASAVCTDSCVGAGMTASDMHRKIRAAFINDAAKPHAACTTRDKGEHDSRMWDGRSFVVCGKQWEVVRRECTTFKGCVDRINNMQLTGNVGEEDVFRCASLLYSDGGKSISHVYDCVRNPNYHIAKPFKLLQPYCFLSRNTTLLEAGGVDVCGYQKRERPIGTKAAKRLKAEKAAKKKEGDSWEASIGRIEKMLETNAAHRHALSKQKLRFQKEKMEWEMAKTLLGPGSNATVQERDNIGTLLRKRLMNSLASTPIETCETGNSIMESENESNGVSALLKMSAVSVPSEDVVSPQCDLFTSESS